MKEFRSVYQWAIIVDSILIVALVVTAVLVPRFPAALPLAGVLAGVNAMLHSRALEGLRPGLKRLLLIGGLATVVLMLAVLAFRS